MPYKIVADNCTGCSACEPECPNKAIYETPDGLFAIDPNKCTECIGFYDEPQCVAVCPIEDTCVIDTRYPRYQAV
ncbi:MAG: 4Fe-4S binding protein [Methylohalobius sp.]|nr:4Fe-4S binding protein [Methylohalobius sp.]